jgi:sugar/nucleoside kinase (ribokinase family)
MTRAKTPADPEVLTLGEAMVLFEAVGEPALRIGSRFTLRVAGAESNFAIALARLGLPVAWLSRVGADRYGRLVTDALAQEGVDLRYVERSSKLSTGVFFRWHDAGSPQIAYYRSGSAATELQPSDLPDDAFRSVRLLHLTGITPALSEGARALVVEAARRAHGRGVTVTFDPNYRSALWSSPRAAFDSHRSLLRFVDWYLCGQVEGKLLVDVRSNDDLWKALRGLGIRGTCIRTGRDGALVSNGDGLQAVRPTRLISVVDEVGAGDGFAAGFVYGLRHGWDPVRCAHAGNTVARTALGHPGDWEAYPRAERFWAEL